MPPGEGTAGAAPRRGHAIIGTLRRWTRFAGVIAGLILCVPLHYLCRLLRLPSPWPRRFLWWVGWVAGLRIRVTGHYRRSHVLFVSNHASWLDILAIGGTTGAAFVAKAELASFGLIRWLADMNDTIYVERQERRKLHGHVDTIREALGRTRAVAMFPEATTHGGRDLLPFRASLFSSLFPPIEGLIVQPIALDFGDIAEEIAWGDEHGRDNFRRIFERPGTIKLTLRFLDPLTPGGDLDRKRLAAIAREEIVAALHASDEAPGPLYGAG